MKGYNSIMEKRIEKEIITIEHIREIYCDKCGKFLGSLKENDVTAYSDVVKRHYFIKCCSDLIFSGFFCDDCKNKIASQIEEALTKIGFKR